MNTNIELTQANNWLPQDLIDELIKENLVIFVGAGLSIGAGLPSWDEVIQYLAEITGVSINENDYLKAAQHYENKFGRNYLLIKTKEFIKIRNVKPTENHFLLAELPLSVIVTTNFDELLEITFDTIKKPYHRIILDKGIAYWNEKEEVQLLKMHGSIDDEDSIVLTEADYRNYFSNHKAITIKLKDLLMSRSFLFLGYSISDPNFNLLYGEIRDILKGHQKKSYIIDFDVNDVKRFNYENKGLSVIDLKEKQLELNPNIDVSFKSLLYSKRLNQFLKLLRSACISSRKQISRPQPKSDEEIKIAQYLEELLVRLRRDDELKNYVEHKCEESVGANETLLTDQLRDWLSSDNYNLLVLLGDYGTGKTIFCRKLTVELAQKYLENPLKNKIPILIFLREFTKADSIESLIENSLKKYNLTYREFTQIASDGRVVIIFDGFDEMSAHLRRQVSFENIVELSKLFYEKSKIIITSRTHYFKRKMDEEKIFSIKDDVFTGIRLRDKKIPVKFIYLKDFSLDDIILYLQYKFGQQWRHYAKKVHAIYDLEDLARRPILLNLIAQTLPELNDYSGEIQQHQLYSIYIDLWLSREEWRGIEKNEILLFVENLAFQMFQSSEFSVNLEKLEESVLEHFKERILSYMDLQDFDGKIRTCSFLNRDADGNYTFMHRSFIEYFVAKRFARKIKEKKQDFGRWKISPEIALFASQLISQNDQVTLLNWIDFTATESYDKKDFLGCNAITLLGACKKNLAGFNFSGAFLREAFLQGLDLHKTILDRANLDNAILDSANMFKVSLDGASLENASLVKANLSNSNLRANFTSSNLSEAILDESDLSNSLLISVNLESSSLWGAHMEQACLRGAILTDTNLDHANLQCCDLHLTDLRGASLKYSNLINIKIELTNFSSSDLDGTLFRPQVCLEDRYDEEAFDWYGDEEYEKDYDEDIIDVFEESLSEDSNEENYSYSIREDLAPLESELDVFVEHVQKKYYNYLDNVKLNSRN